MMNNIEAVIFDMDGTLIDSMSFWSEIDKTYLSKLNIKAPHNLKQDIQHLTFEETAIYFKNKFNLKDSIDKIMQDWNDMAYYQYKNKIKLKPGVKKFLAYLKSLNMKLAIATSNCTLLIEAVLKSNGIYDYFEVITTADEVSRGKNYPDIYLLTAKKLNVDPKNCLVFEDILPAVKGAKAAGMTVIGVYDKFSENEKDEIIKYADKYIFDYSELENLG